MLLNKSQNLVIHKARARYIYMDGVKILHSIQRFSRAVFKEDGWESCAKEAVPKGKGQKSLGDASRRRAQKKIFEYAMCNEHLNAFFTITYAEGEGFDRTQYDHVYPVLKRWLSNHVQRKGLSYIMVAERHKKGGIHFHGICNADALRLRIATNAHTGEAITDRGRPVYNIVDWEKMGFSTCKILPTSVQDRVKVSKYITKYITKDTEKIGGRWFLHGGNVKGWMYEYGEEAEDFTKDTPREWWCCTTEGGEYTEYQYL